MLTAAQSATDGGTVTQRVTYAYDAFGSRIQRQGWDGTTTTTERYGLDGWDTAKPSPVGNESFDAWVDLDGSNDLVTRRVWGAGFDEVVARQSAGGTVAWYLGDHQGSVRNVIDNSAAVLATSTFDAYGKLVSGSRYDPMGYTGQSHDSLTGFVGMGEGTREYDAATSRFLSHDPKGFAAGDANLYRYVGNSPTNATDPSGMWITTTSKADADNILARLQAISGASSVIPQPRPAGDGRYIFDAVTDSASVRTLEAALALNGTSPPRKPNGNVDLAEQAWREAALNALIGTGKTRASVAVSDAKSLAYTLRFPLLFASGYDGAYLDDPKSGQEQLGRPGGGKPGRVMWARPERPSVFDGWSLFNPKNPFEDRLRLPVPKCEGKVTPQPQTPAWTYFPGLSEANDYLGQLLESVDRWLDERIAVGDDAPVTDGGVPTRRLFPDEYITRRELWYTYFSFLRPVPRVGPSIPAKKAAPASGTIGKVGGTVDTEIAAGLGGNRNVQLRGHADRTGGKAYWDWPDAGLTSHTQVRGIPPETFGKIADGAFTKTKRIHFDLTGLGDPAAAAAEGARLGWAHDNLTKAELNLIRSRPDLLEKTTFYRNGVEVPNPFK